MGHREAPKDPETKKKEDGPLAATAAKPHAASCSGAVAARWAKKQPRICFERMLIKQSVLIRFPLIIQKTGSWLRPLRKEPKIGLRPPAQSGPCWLELRVYVTGTEGRCGPLIPSITRVSVNGEGLSGPTLSRVGFAPVG